MSIEYKTIFKLNDDGTCIFRDNKYEIQEREGERYIECDGEEYKFIERNEQIKAVLDSSSEIYDFTYCIFLIKANFSDSIFQEKANFIGSTFNEEASFIDSTFQEEADFMGSTFQKKAYFMNSTFKEEASFSATKINFLNFSNVKTEKNFIIDLSYSEIEKLDYEGTDFKDAQNSESYLKLKNFALKNNDQKNALNFYKKEMEKYRQEARINQKSMDMFILSFEKFVSEYGTNPLRPLSIMLVISFLFSVFLVINLENKNLFSITILLLNPTSSIEKLVDNPRDVPLFWEALNFLKNIFFSILIYEVIKSFRKFSRKL